MAADPKPCRKECSMNAIDTFIVQINEILGEWIHMGSSMSSVAALNLCMF